MKLSDVFRDRTKNTGLFNIQAIDNISSIMKHGILSYDQAKEFDHRSVAMPEVQKRRDKIRVFGKLYLHQYANLYFDPRNPMLSARRSQNEELCILKIDCSVIDLEGVVLSDRNASSEYARFYLPEDGLKKIDFEIVYQRWWTDKNPYEQMRKKSMKCAEVLVPGKVPYDLIVGAAVFNDAAKGKLELTGFGKPIFVEEDLFF